MRGTFTTGSQRPRQQRPQSLLCCAFVPFGLLAQHYHHHHQRLHLIYIVFILLSNSMHKIKVRAWTTSTKTTRTTLRHSGAGYSSCSGGVTVFTKRIPSIFSLRTYTRTVFLPMNLISSSQASSSSSMATPTRTTTVSSVFHQIEQSSREVHISNEMPNQLKDSSNEQRQDDGIIMDTMYQVKVTVCQELRQELKLTGREKRGRVFLKHNSTALTSLKALLGELHSFFRALKKNTYVLTAAYPLVAEDGKIMAAMEHSDNNSTGTSRNTTNTHYWPIASDEDVIRTFHRADDFYQKQDPNRCFLKRPAIVIHVAKDPNLPPPPPPPAYLVDMPDPIESTHMTMLSFYSFPEGGIPNPQTYVALLRRLWQPFHVLGRVYVATEGINAQMSVPTNVLSHFEQCCLSLPNNVGQYLSENGGINIDPVHLTREEYAGAGQDGAPPFVNLHIRDRTQVVADGLDKALDWNNVGYDMPALEFHERLKEEKTRRQINGTSNVIVLDCRNTYETNVGRFEVAEPLETDNFRDSWDALRERLKNVPKDTPVMGLCTGGIRCVKIGAYVTQELGFTNFSRLSGGIIAYDRTLKAEMPQEESLFKGSNFVFDGRLQRPITDDQLGTCLTCGSRTSLVSNCRNENCHRRMIQCEHCRGTFDGTCSTACRQRLRNSQMIPQRQESVNSVHSVQSNEPSEYVTLNDYCEGHSSPIPSVFPEMELNTQTLIPSGSHMISGRSQGRLLTQMASMTRHGRILEIGTFTGYATACLVQGAIHVGQSLCTNNGSRDEGPYVMTLERDGRAYQVAVAQLEILSKYGVDSGDVVVEALCALRSGDMARQLQQTNYKNDHSTKVTTLQFDGVATCELVKVTDALATLEEMVLGQCELIQPETPFDFVFLDADKTRLLEYVETLLSNDRILRKGGMIVVDNVLWKGLVLDAASSGCHRPNSPIESANDSDDDNDDYDDGNTIVRRNRRARQLANKMHRFNSEIVHDDRVEVLVLPVRDGLSVIRKK